MIDTVHRGRGDGEGEGEGDTAGVVEAVNMTETKEANESG